MKSHQKNISNFLRDKPEFHLIIRVLSGNYKPEEGLLDEVDREEFIALIKYHRLVSILYHELAKQNISLPIEIHQKLELMNTKNKMRMLKLTSELIRIHKLFDDNNIDYISLKGPALSQQVYGDYTIRSSRDLDLLIKEKDQEKIVGLLNSVGYVLEGEIDNRRYHDVSFVNLDTRVKLEIHTRLFSNKYLMPIDDSCFSRVETVRILDHDVKVMESKENMQYLALHGEQHQWSHLYWIYDISRLIEDEVLNNEFDKRTIYKHVKDLIGLLVKKGGQVNKRTIRTLEIQSRRLENNKLRKFWDALNLKPNFRYKKEVVVLRLFRIIK